MSHQLTYRPASSYEPLSAHLSRRALLRRGAGLALALTGARTGISARAQTAMAIRVAAPQILHIDGCLVTVAVPVTLLPTPVTRRYALYGDILEWDADTEDAAFCGTLDAQHVRVSPGELSRVTLRQQVTAVNLGLVRGMGPAQDEHYSPNLVELVARIWLRNLDTETVHGPWNSPQRVAVSRSARSWVSPSQVLANPLLTSRGQASAALPTSEEETVPAITCST